MFKLIMLTFVKKKAKIKPIFDFIQKSLNWIFIKLILTLIFKNIKHGERRC
jgi:hypothetical protein